MKSSEFDQYKYWKAADLGEIGSEKRFKIRAITKEVIGEKQETKPVLWFTNSDRGLPLNHTNRRYLQSVFGDEMDRWIGKVVAVYSTMVDLRGQMVPALRVRIPPPKDNYRAPPPKPQPKPPVDEELDDFDAPEQLDDDISDVR